MVLAEYSSSRLSTRALKSRIFWLLGCPALALLARAFRVASSSRSMPSCSSTSTSSILFILLIGLKLHVGLFRLYIGVGFKQTQP